jgi:hypothetical protein
MDILDVRGQYKYILATRGLHVSLVYAVLVEESILAWCISWSLPCHDQTAW